LTNRDEFPVAVVRILAARAGHRCSVCHKATSGPGATDNTAHSDGIAAHITGASPKGPRYEPTLSPQQRKAANNGIWTCTQHAREIDSVSSSYTVSALRGLRQIREDFARRELQSSSKTEDASPILVELPYAETADKLVSLIAPQEYTFQTTSSVRAIVHASPRGRRLLDLIPDVIIGTWESHPNVSGILGTLLSASIGPWSPSSAVISKLEQLCLGAIHSDEWPRVALVEPVAFAIGAKGRSEVHRKVLQRLVKPTKWRDADVARQRQYYGGVGAELAAVLRHWNHRYRKGLLRAHDVGRLMDLMLSESLLLKEPHAKNRLIDLLNGHAKVLADHGERDLVRAVMDFTEALRICNAKSGR